MKITIIPIDKHIRIGDNSLSQIKEDMTWVPTNIHALQWYDTFGEIEYNDGTPNEIIEELGIYEQALETFDTEKQRRLREQLAEEELIEASRDYWEELRNMRNYKLSVCDWTQGNDSPITEAKKQEWTLYRQALRDVPSNTTDPKRPFWPLSPSS
jgi:hypothetical protein